MVCPKGGGTVEHRLFHQITDYFRAGDLLLLNDTRVIPARLVGRKVTGGEVELLLVRKICDGEKVAAVVYHDKTVTRGKGGDNYTTPEGTHLPR